jgi:hypothetical protein
MIGAVACPLNFVGGWSLVLAGFVSGAAIGLGFHRDDFLGGYTSLRRRMVRLGHIAFVALGVLNVLFAISPSSATNVPTHHTIASICFLAGGVAMPVVCFLTAWRERFRHLFFIPVSALIAAVVFTLLGALS